MKRLLSVLLALVLLVGYLPTGMIHVHAEEEDMEMPIQAETIPEETGETIPEEIGETEESGDFVASEPENATEETEPDPEIIEVEGIEIEGNFYAANSVYKWITNRSEVDGYQFTKCSELAEKLNSIFDGNASVYSDEYCNNLVNTRIGTSNVPDDRIIKYAGAKGKYAINSGTSCWIYANGVYYTLFEECTASGTAGKNSVRLSLSNTSNKTASYNNFKTWGVREGVGALIRAQGHSMIVLGYDENQLIILDGNGNGNGLVSIRVRTWDQISFSVEYIIQPKDAYYDSKYPDCDHDSYGYKDNGICKNCGYEYKWSLNTGAAGVYSVTEEFTPRLGGPYDVETEDTQKTFKAGDKVTVYGSLTNAYKNTWYQIGYGDGKVGYVYGGHLTKYSDPLVVKYNANGGSGAPGNQTKVYGTTLKLSSTKPTRSGYTFLGWATSSSATSATYSAGGNYTSNASTTLYAVWGQALTLTFAPNGGTCTTTEKSVSKNAAVGTLPTPTLSGYSFLGWYTQPFAGSKITSSSTVSADTTVYAHWQRTANKLMFYNYDALSGTVIEAQLDRVNEPRGGAELVVYNENASSSWTNEYGTEIAVNSKGQVVAYRAYGDANRLTIPDDGFILSGQHGWDSETSSSYGGYTIVNKIKEMADPHVSVDYETGTITAYDSYDAYLLKESYFGSGAVYKELPVVKRAGYVFEGWFDSNGKRAVYNESIQDYKLTAKWSTVSAAVPIATASFGGHGYELFDSPMSWAEAKAICESRGGHLVTITSKDEQAAVFNLAQKGSYGIYYIGCTDEVTEGTWKWVTGESFSYNNWDPDYPEPDGAATLNYGLMVNKTNPPNKQPGEWMSTANKYRWNFYDASNTGFICEYDGNLPCSHTYTTTKTDATCTTDGSIVYKCSKCGDSYRETIKAKGHTEVTVAGKAATCTTAGKTDGKKCSVCGVTTVAQKTIAAKGHTEVTVAGKAATCTQTGLTDGKKCSVCGVTTVAQTTIKAKGHTEVTVAGKAATCTTAGKTDGKKCSVCGVTTVAQTTIAAKGHTEVIVAGKAATCTTAGKTDGKKCSVCGVTTVAQTTIAAKGHSWKDATCTAPKTCTRCSTTEGSKLGHSWKAATCTAPKTCTRCSTTEGSKLGHSWKAATCTAPKTCTRCSTTEGSKLGHSYASGVCTRCGAADPNYVAFGIVTQPQNVTVKNGATAKTTVVANGEGLTYAWYFTSNAADTSFSKSSTTTATYSTVMDASRDGRKVYCVITNADGKTVTSKTVTLSMEKTPLAITQQPSSVTVVNGASAKTSVKATGDGLTYTWYFTSGGTATKFSKSSITSATYSTTMSADRDGRKVYCVITDSYGQSVTTKTVTLSMKEAIKIVTQPQDVKVSNGATAKVSVVAQGENLTYTWYYANKGKTTFTKSSITTATYSTTMDDARDGRRVYCKVSDQYGNTVKTATVTMYMYTPLAIVQQPASVTVAEGAAAKTTVTVNGDGLTYAWYFTSNGSSTTFSKSSITTATYSTTMDTTRDGRRVYCVITDRYGDSVTTNTVALRMKARTTLAITQQPTSVTVANGATAKTTVKANGDGLTYAWYFTSNAADTTFSKSSTTTATYSTAMDASRDGRKVYCKITDQYGNTVTTKTVTLSMQKTSLVITQQPVNVTVAKGATAKTTVKATGDGLKYTWYFTSGGSSTTFSKSSITSATYSTTMDASRDGRKIYCVITDAYGQSVTTKTVTLSMAQSSTGTPLKIVTQPANVTVANGKTAKATVVAQGDGLTYAWYYTSNGTTSKFYKSSTTTATYSTTMDASRDGRQIYCVITDAYGKTVTTNTVTLKMS